MIRANTLVEDFEYVSQYDEAVDKSAEDFDHKWTIYRDGLGDPPIKTGETPTRFKLRHLTATERLYLLELSQGEEHGLYIAAAAIALIGVKGMNGADGKPHVIRQEVTHVGPVRLRHASKESLDAFPMEILLELGGLVVERVTARPS